MLDRVTQMLAVIGRALLGTYFLLPGISKVVAFDATRNAMADHGVPLVMPALIITIALQVGGGLALIANYRTQIVALALAALTLLINGFMHDFWNYAEGMERAHETQNFVKNLAIMAGLLVLAGGSRRAAEPA